MYLNELQIIKKNQVIREVNFRNGINFIVDFTGVDETGNDVGKTTTLKLIDFCLGAKKGIIYANGAWLGANTIIIRNTERKNCLVVLDNSSNIFFNKIIEELKTIANTG